MQDKTVQESVGVVPSEAPISFFLEKGLTRTAGDCFGKIEKKRVELLREIEVCAKDPNEAKEKAVEEYQNGWGEREALRIASEHSAVLNCQAQWCQGGTKRCVTHVEIQRPLRPKPADIKKSDFTVFATENECAPRSIGRKIWVCSFKFTFEYEAACKCPD